MPSSHTSTLVALRRMEALDFFRINRGMNLRNLLPPMLILDLKVAYIFKTGIWNKPFTHLRSDAPNTCQRRAA